MFNNWSIKKLITVFGGILIILFLLQIALFLNYYPEIFHFGLLVIALFVALILFHSINLKLKSNRK